MTAPAGCIGLIQQTALETLADSAAFRTLVGAVTGDEAAKRAAARAEIHYEGFPDPAGGEEEYSSDEVDGYWPYAIVALDDTAGFSAVKVDTDCFEAEGRVWIMIGQLPLANDSRAEQDVKFKKLLGAIIDELIEMCGGQSDDTLVSYLAFDRVDVLAIARDRDRLPDDVGEEQWATLALHFQNGIVG